MEVVDDEEDDEVDDEDDEEDVVDVVDGVLLSLLSSASTANTRSASSISMREWAVVCWTNSRRAFTVDAFTGLEAVLVEPEGAAVVEGTVEGVEEGVEGAELEEPEGVAVEEEAGREEAAGRLLAACPRKADGPPLAPPLPEAPNMLNN